MAWPFLTPYSPNKPKNNCESLKNCIFRDFKVKKHYLRPKNRSQQVKTVTATLYDNVDPF